MISTLLHLLEGGEVALADEEPLAGEQLVEHDAHGEDVAASVDRQAPHLLGRHVAELALEDARLRLAGLARGLGDAEVDELHLAVVRDEHVLRRDVAVHEVEVAAGGVLLVVRVVEALADLHGHVAGHGHGHGLAALARPVEDRAQVLAVHVLHGDEVRASPTFPRSKICAMFAWVSCTAIFASSTNIVMNSLSSAMFGRMRLTATRRSKPSTPKALALKTSAMPPTLIRSRSSTCRTGPASSLRSPGSVPTLARAVVARRHCPLRGVCLAEPQRPAPGGGRPRLGPPRAARP
jgi:hypothetical protein